jgi:hypothetical protein
MIGGDLYCTASLSLPANPSNTPTSEMIVSGWWAPSAATALFGLWPEPRPVPPPGGRLTGLSRIVQRCVTLRHSRRYTTRSRTGY